MRTRFNQQEWDAYPALSALLPPPGQRNPSTDDAAKDRGDGDRGVGASPSPPSSSLHAQCAKRHCGACSCWVLRWFVPAGLVGCIGLQVVAMIERQAGIFLTLRAPDGAFCIPGCQLEAGFVSQEDTSDIFYWSNLQDGIQGGAAITSIISACLTGTWLYVCLLAYLVLWFLPIGRYSGCGCGSLGLLVAVLAQTTKWCTWFLCTSFITVLSFQLDLTFDWGRSGENLLFIEAQIAATTGSYFMSAAILTSQFVSNVIFVVSRRLPHEDMLEDYTPRQRARRGSMQTDKAAAQRPTASEARVGGSWWPDPVPSEPDSEQAKQQAHAAADFEDDEMGGGSLPLCARMWRDATRTGNRYALVGAALLQVRSRLTANPRPTVLRVDRGFPMYVTVLLAVTKLRAQRHVGSGRGGPTGRGLRARAGSDQPDVRAGLQHRGGVGRHLPHPIRLRRGVQERGDPS
jgi:hypothetical protein